MAWVKLNSKKMSRALYNPVNERLYIKFFKRGAVEHRNISLHCYQSLVESTDQDFYYYYYIEPARIRKRPSIFRAMWLRRLIGAGVLAGLLVVPDALEVSNGSIFHLFNRTTELDHVALRN